MPPSGDSNKCQSNLFYEYHIVSGCNLPNRDYINQVDNYTANSDTQTDLKSFGTESEYEQVPGEDIDTLGIENLQH